MIIAVGTDLIEIYRIKQMLEREPSGIHKLFTQQELEYSARFSDPAPSLAARFAAKEAFQKVWARPHAWKDVWVERRQSSGGAFEFEPPELCFCGEIASEMQVKGWVTHLSLTHTKEYASAVVILEKP